MRDTTQVQLVRRPEGWPTEEDFRTVGVELGDLAPGQVRVRVRNEFLSVDPYMRGRMNDGPRGVENAVAAFLSMMRGGDAGQMVVRVGRLRR